MMKKALLFLSLFAGAALHAQNCSFYISNNSPMTGSLSLPYTVSITIEISGGYGPSLLLTSEAHSIEPGKTQEFYFTIPEGFTVNKNNTIFRINSGECERYNLTTLSDRVKGNGAGCFGIYHITEWVKTDSFHYSVAANLLPGGL